MTAAIAVRGQLTRPAGTGLEELMGSQIDVLKLVSCMTLFAAVAKALHAAEGREEFAVMAEHAEAILAMAAAHGYRRCAFTEEHLQRRPR